jgi:hypothetical protein
MTARRGRFLIGVASIGLAFLTAGVQPLHGEVPPVFVSAVPPARRAPVTPRMTADECSMLALRATLAKTRAELRTVVPVGSVAPNAIGLAMNSDRRLSDGIKRTFANSDVIMSQYTKRGECVVTLKLSVDRLEKLGRDLR